MKTKNIPKRIAIFLILKIVEISVIVGLLVGSYSLGVYFNGGQENTCSIKNYDEYTTNPGFFNSYSRFCTAYEIVFDYTFLTLIGACAIFILLAAFIALCILLFKFIIGNWELAGELT